MIHRDQNIFFIKYEIVKIDTENVDVKYYNNQSMEGERKVPLNKKNERSVNRLKE